MAQEFPLETHVFKAPCKKLFSQEDVNIFFESAPCANMVGYIQALQAAVKGKGRSQTQAGDNCEHILELVSTLSEWVDQVDPIE